MIEQEETKEENQLKEEEKLKKELELKKKRKVRGYLAGDILEKKGRRNSYGQPIDQYGRVDILKMQDEKEKESERSI